MLKKEMKQDEYREEDDNCKDEEYDEYGEYEDDEEEYSTTDDDNEEEDEEEHSSSNHPTSQKFAIPSLFSLVRGKNKSSNNTTSQTTSHTNQLDQSSASHSKKNDNNNSKGAMSNLTSNNLTNSNKEIHPSTTTAAAIVNNHASASVRSNTAPSTSKLDEHSEISNTSKSSNLATNNNVTTNLPPSSSQLPTILRTSMIPVSSTQQQNVAQNTAASEPQQQPQHHTPAAHPSEPQKTMFQENISQFRRSTNHSSSYSTTSSLSSIDDYVINSMVGTNHSNRNVLKQAAKTIPQKGNTPSPLFVSNLSSSYEYSMKLMELERQQSNNPIKRIMNMKYGEYSLSDDEDEETSDEDSIYGKGHGVSAADDKVYRVAESHQSRYIPSDDESLMFDEEADDDDFDF
ncbi:hypothetical protein C9374_007844 [Naegleria lovaniensis]|uniref:Uncharacterized protein n=1 Tax=Naegleria lovaniensis TaxID=51637 RepID=A0AA88GLJ0_NAELO|nr:uncharacterized protein C9374_007844 [Naegleria lovaniensis]KAG2378696.1 hypothetical protein C9374_007844 [Naegleria lovaniensis]